MNEHDVRNSSKQEAQLETGESPLRGQQGFRGRRTGMQLPGTRGTLPASERLLLEILCTFYD